MLRLTCMTLLMVATITHASAQGCGDAGFCSTGTLQQAWKHSVKRQNEAGFSVTTSNGEKKLWMVSPQLELKIYAIAKSYVEFKLPYHYIHGNLGSNYGIGDLITTFTSDIKTKNPQLKIRYTAGFKMGLGNGDDDKVGKPLPMAYQTSMGTTDAILGVGIGWGKYINLAMGVQQPLVQHNKNGYYTNENRDSVPTAYFSSRWLKRKGDILLRIEAQKAWEHVFIYGGALILYHMGNDISAPKKIPEIVLTGSAGFTVNINAGLYYNAKTWRFDCSIAAPVLTRDNRPDGLTRNVMLIPRFMFLL